MQAIEGQALKAILHSKRANLYYLEHCRVLVQGGRVCYVTEQGKQSLYWNIPIANTTCVLLGTGTSLTQAAMRELARAGVMVGFCGGDGSPLLAGTDAEPAVAWLSPQSEYRPTEYLQAWVSFWFDDAARLRAAQALQSARLGFLAKRWLAPRHATLSDLPQEAFRTFLETVEQSVQGARDVAQLLSAEARCSKQLYAWAAQCTQYGSFTRGERGSAGDPANRFLDHGNYLAYGLAATACWVLGLPHGLALMHGKTRRGALVFDVADLVKDAVVLPQAFASACAGDSDQQFRQACMAALLEAEALDFMIDTLKHLALHHRKPAEAA
jgi:CRISP-associated protein Cas1